jgi:sensor histidine kinase YesM
MDQVDDPDNLHIPRTRRRDEIGALYRSFRFMIDRVTQLARAQREAELRRRQVELKLLHSQIRPHFVGNTLACIASLAKQNRRDEVVETLRSLILLLSTTADQIEELVTLREEMACLDAYVVLQKMRYRELFDYRAEVEERCLDCRVPKLLLEPLVENSIFHGFADERQGGMIRVSARAQNRHLSIEVIDNGRGIEPARLAEIRAYLSDLHGETKAGLEGRFGSIGLRNTHERLRLTFGEGYGLSVRSSPGSGTVVAVRVPLIPAGQECTVPVASGGEEPKQATS